MCRLQRTGRTAEVFDVTPVLPAIEAVEALMGGDARTTFNGRDCGGLRSVHAGETSASAMSLQWAWRRMARRSASRSVSMQ